MIIALSGRQPAILLLNGFRWRFPCGNRIIARSARVIVFSVRGPFRTLSRLSGKAPFWRATASIVDVKIGNANASATDPRWDAVGSPVG